MVFIFRLLSFLPLSILHLLGAGLGRLTYWLSPTYRRHLRENLPRLGWHQPGTARWQTGKQMLELARIWMRPLEEAVPLVVDIVGWEHVQAARQAGKGSFS
jgi:KDO2-lipid IV(A) lauroyltransferase